MSSQIASASLRLLDGTYQITRLKLHCDGNNVVRIPLEIDAPVYTENRVCHAVFYKKGNKSKALFYKEVDADYEDNKMTFA